MRVVKTEIEGCLLIEPTIHCDARGYFFESFNARDFEQEMGFSPCFVQDNESIKTVIIYVSTAQYPSRGDHFPGRA